jgi:hypothetical protein
MQTKYLSMIIIILTGTSLIVSNKKAKVFLVAATMVIAGLAALGFLG